MGNIKFIVCGVLMTMMACQTQVRQKDSFTGEENEVKLIVLDPGHFHASLVQKTMLPQIDSQVYVYAPQGAEVEAYLKMIEGYNRRSENPTSWNEITYTGQDYFEKMISEHKGNVVVLAGNNLKKTDYIAASVKNGFNVLSDKPMAINGKQFEILDSAFVKAKEEGVMLYDIMTERYEPINAIQKKIMQSKEVFGELTLGTPENPAVEMESVHHFVKMVSGSPLTRPAWYYDVEQQGEGIVDVTTHLIDLVNWKCFPDQSIDYKTEVVVNDAGRWPTKISPADFALSTKLPEYPEFLKKDVQNDTLSVYSNGYIQYAVKGLQVKIDVIWNVQAPEGTSDTHKAVIKGTHANLLILQGKEQQYKPELYIQKVADVDDQAYLAAVNDLMAKLQKEYPGVSAVQESEGIRIDIPSELVKGHEASFSKVTESFLGYLIHGMPAWEVPNMLAKYYITTKALEMAKQK